ncbi:MAG: YqgE/AlgH family protein [Bacteroidia bacterium]|nr:YqgE/AlgH family protein [Bacteroidia bacterium]
MTTDNEFFKIGNIIPPGQGRVLIAEPFLDDMYFGHAIVLLTEHNNEGTVGFVINNRIELKINEILIDFPRFDAPVSIGGPVGKDTVHFIHTIGKSIRNCKHVLDNLYWGGEFEELKQLINSGAVHPRQVRFFIGYSGWMPGQLESELANNSWVVSELSSQIIMKYHEKSNWNQTLEKLGDKYKTWANFPENPSMN